MSILFLFFLSLNIINVAFAGNYQDTSFSFDRYAGITVDYLLFAIDLWNQYLFYSSHYAIAITVAITVTFAITFWATRTILIKYNLLINLIFYLFFFIMIFIITIYHYIFITKGCISFECFIFIFFIYFWIFFYNLCSICIIIIFVIIKVISPWVELGMIFSVVLFILFAIFKHASFKIWKKPFQSHYDEIIGKNEKLEKFYT